MTDSSADSSASPARVGELETALEQVVAAARAHLAAIRVADGEPDDDAVWDAYVALNNASHVYDDLLNDVFGEVTPWDLEAISSDEAQAGRGMLTIGNDASTAPELDDAHPSVVSVRQRRDSRVPSVTALLRVATEARPPVTEGGPTEPIAGVAEAVLELLQSGDGSLGMLDLPELEPLDGVVIVAEVNAPFNPEAHDPADAEAPFRMADADRIAGRLDERDMSELDEE